MTSIQTQAGRAPSSIYFEELEPAFRDMKSRKLELASLEDGSMDFTNVLEYILPQVLLSLLHLFVHC